MQINIHDLSTPVSIKFEEIYAGQVFCGAGDYDCVAGGDETLVCVAVEGYFYSEEDLQCIKSSKDLKHKSKCGAFYLHNGSPAYFEDSDRVIVLTDSQLEIELTD